MEKRLKFNIGTIIAFTALSYVVYYLLVSDNSLHISIGYIISHTHHMALKKHLIVLGLLPVYIAIMVFGAATLGTYIGSSLQHLITRTVNNIK